MASERHQEFVLNTSPGEGTLPLTCSYQEYISVRSCSPDLAGYHIHICDLLLKQDDIPYKQRQKSFSGLFLFYCKNELMRHRPPPQGILMYHIISLYHIIDS